MNQTSPFSGTDGVRIDGLPGTPSDSFVFAGNGGNRAASSFIEGFIKPGGMEPEFRADGLLPSILFNNTGGTYTTTVNANLSPIEERLVAANPYWSRRIGEFIQRNPLIVYGAVFVLAWFAMRKVVK